jgi:hypothetical protein
MPKKKTKAKTRALNEENKPDSDNQAPDAGKEFGPLERERYFLKQRLATIQPPGGQARSAVASMARAARAAEPSPKAGKARSPLSADFRQNLTAQYRARQKAKLPARARAALSGRPPRGAVAREAAAPPPFNNWIPIGPSVVRKGQASNRPAVSGRVAGIAIASLAGGTRVYLASANGGVWRSDDNGLNWHSTMDAWDLNPTTRASDSLACGAIAISPTNPDRVYVGTGEGGSGAYFGVGPIRTDDGGVNWFTEPTDPASPTLAGKSFYRLAVDPGDPERVVGATDSGLYRREPAGGSFNWVRKLAGEWSSVVAARTASTTTFYAARYGGPVRTSTDGHSWTPISTGFPSSNVGRISLAVRPDDPTVLYALIAKGDDFHLLGVYRFNTSDNTWRKINSAPTDLFGSDPTDQGQGWYDIAIAVDPNNANRIYLGGSTKLSGGQWSGCLYRCNVTSSGSGSGLNYSMTKTSIGGTVHADLHELQFTPTDSNKLWVGCDGGIFLTNNATGGANFEPRNTGLATLTMNHLDIHPTEPAVLFCGTQDNGTTRYTGEEAWLHSDAGDGGFVVINWNDPYKILRTYVQGILYRTTDGGQSYDSWDDVSLPSPDFNNAEFYAPLVGTPVNTAAPAEADIVAFGGERPWISTSFGGAWQSIPNNSSSDKLPSNILSLAFASATRLYAGTIGGQVYRFNKSGASWTRTRIDAAPLLVGPITDIAVDTSDATGNSIYVTLGGTGDYRHVWRYNGTTWQQRSGPSAGSATSLLDIQHNAIVVDPAHTNNLYVGADIGIWRSTNGGTNWASFSEGLPDAAVLDLKLHNPRRILFAATHGRGVFERTIDLTSATGVELYIRDTQLDLGRYTTIDGLNDPTQQGATVAHWRGPDIKVDAPSAMGTYQTPTNQISFFEFVDAIVDGSGGVASVDPSVGTAVNRVYVQLHNRGVTPANNVRVMLLLANASAGLPNLPAGYAANVQTGTPISTANWQTVGFQTINNLRVGFPQIAAFDLPSTMLPPPASLTGNAHHCLLALLHSASDDPFTNTQAHVDTLSPAERKAAHKNLNVVQFTGTLPPSPPAPHWMAISLNGADKQMVNDLVIDLLGYGGRVRLMIPKDMELLDGLNQSLVGLRVEEQKDFDEFADKKLEQLARYQKAKTFNPKWCQQMAQAIRKLKGQRVLFVGTNREPAVLRRIQLPADKSHTIFVAIDRPQTSRVGDLFNFNIYQRDSERKTVIGGATCQVQIVPRPDVEKRLASEVTGKRSPTTGSETLYVKVTDEKGNYLTPDDGAEVGAYLYNQQGVVDQLHALKYHGGWQSFYLRVDDLPHLSAGVVRVTAIAKVKNKEARKTQEIVF